MVVTVADDWRVLEATIAGESDTVSARYYQRTEVRLITDDAEQLQSKGVGAVARSAEGETPYLTTVDVEQFVATITAIDIEAGTFKLRDDVGTVEEFTAERPEYLQRAEVGDLVVFTVEEINYMGLEKASNVRD